jgi:hypothetical protein
LAVVSCVYALVNSVLVELIGAENPEYGKNHYDYCHYRE